MDIDTRFALIDKHGVRRYPYKKHQKITGRFGYALTREGEQDRGGAGTYADDIETVIIKVVHEGWSVRAMSFGGSGNTVGILKKPNEIIIGYEISGDLFHLVKTAKLAPIRITSRIPGEEQATTSITSSAETENPVDETVFRQIKSRRGQVDFRNALLIAYDRKCFVTGSAVVSVLEAAHIIPHAESANYSINNGVLLRADIHTLYDLNMIGIDGKGTVHIRSDLIDSEYGRFNGKTTDIELHEKLSDNFRERFKSFFRKMS